MSLSAFNFLKFSVYYNKTEIDAQTLFWQQQKQFTVPLSTRGSRRCYGQPEWVSTECESLDPTKQVNFNEVLTSSVGDIELFADGKVNAKDAEENVFQEEDPGQWY